MYDIPLQELEASKDGNGWIGAILKGLKRSSPTGLKITLRSVITQYMIRNRYHAWKRAASYYIEFEFIRNNSPWLYLSFRLLEMQCLPAGLTES